MSISDFIISLINKRRKKIEINYSGALGDFFRDGGNEIIYKRLELDNNSMVIDGGGYHGEFIDKILINFGCKVDSYEPLVNEFNKLEKKYFYNDKVKIYNQAIYSDTKELYLSQEGISSSVITGSDAKKNLKIKAVDIIEIINDKKIVDLLKLNVEGAEYEIMNRIIDSNNLDKFRSFLIQYHRSVENCEELRKKIRKILLEKNFKEIFNYDFVWEYWRR